MRLVSPALLMLCAALSLTTACSSCEDTSGRPAPPPRPSDMTPDDTNPSDMTPDDGGPDEADMEGDMACQGFNCPGEWSEFGECEQVRDLGVIDVAANPTLLLTGSTLGLTSLIQTSCSASAAESAEYVFGFKLSQPALLSLTASTEAEIDLVTELQRGTCGAPELRTCDTGAILTDVLVGADEMTFLVVEGQSGLATGAFEVQVALTPTACGPIASRTCAGDNVSACEPDVGEVMYACGASCSVDACQGDTCDSAIALSAGTPYSASGDLEAYTNKFDARDHASCNLGGLLRTPGAEQIFSLANLTAGQTVTVNAGSNADENDNILMFMRGCPTNPECVEVTDSDDFTWTVPQSGDYFLVIDNLTNFNKAFSHTITIQ